MHPCLQRQLVSLAPTHSVQRRNLREISVLGRISGALSSYRGAQAAPKFPYRSDRVIQGWPAALRVRAAQTEMQMRGLTGQALSSWLSLNCSSPRARRQA